MMLPYCSLDSSLTSGHSLAFSKLLLLPSMLVYRQSFFDDVTSWRTNWTSPPSVLFSC